jgi:hypothetical protein
MLYTTFALARKSGACPESYKKMATALGGVRKYGAHTLIPLTKVIEVCGLQDALWALRFTTENSDKPARIFACDCAWRVLPFYESKYPGDTRVRNCIKTARKFALGDATKEERLAAYSAAWAAAWAAWSAAESAAWSAAWSAAESAAWSAARAAARAAAYSARSAAESARSAELAWQKEHFIELLNEQAQKEKTDAR